MVGSWMVCMVSAWLLAAATAASLINDNCALEKGYDYDDHMGGYNNQTSLRVCANERSENVCIVGGGLSGVHVGWLLKRRGFVNTVVFEKNDRLGGMIYSYYGDEDGSDGITRELSAAFLSPDYYEVRSLLSRYSLTEVVVYLDMMQFHSRSPGDDTDTITSPDVWYDNALALITGSSDVEANNARVDAALDSYLTLHEEIFGHYDSRLPPEPTDSSKLFAIRGTFLEFLQRNELEVLLPMFFQFFVMQGMGTLKGMPAYYGLKWVSPASINSGGFGNDPNAPLGMLKDGFSSMVTALAEDAQLDVRLQHEVTHIDRSAAETGPVLVTTKSADAKTTSHSCDLVVLTGAVPYLTTGSPTADPVVQPTNFEEDLFASKTPMTFMQSLVDIHMQINNNTNSNFDSDELPVSPYKALDYWAAEFSSKGGVIVHRDVGYAETGEQHTLGGIQSYSYHPPPRGASRDEMWTKQQAWMERYGYGTEASGGYDVLGQFYVDTYLFHYTETEIMQRKPWALGAYQGLNSTRTLYVGGSVCFEAMEDVISFNLDLIKQKFDDSDIFESFK